MIDAELDRRPASFSVQVVGVLVAGLALTVAFTIDLGAVLWTALGLLGAGGLVWSATVVNIDPEETTNRQRSLASLALALGSIALLGPLLRLTPLEATLLLPFVAGVVFVGLGGTGTFVLGTATYFTSLCWRSRDIAGLATILVALVYTGLLQGSLVMGAAGFRIAVSINALASLLFLQALCYAVLHLLPRAQAIMEHRIGTPAAKQVAGIAVGDTPITALLPSVRRQLVDFWWVFAAQVFLLAIAPTILDTVLLSIPGVGPAILLLLTSGLLHLLVGALALISGLIVFLGICHSVVTSWASIDPPRVLANAAGGAVAALVVGAVTLVVPGMVTDTLLVGGVRDIAAIYGPGFVLLGSLTVLLLLLPIGLIGATTAISSVRMASMQTSGFLMASVAVLLGTVVAATQGVPALLVFAGVAVTILTWELGEQATYLGSQLGARVETRETEVVHAIGSLAVGGVGIGLASLVGYLVGPINLAVGSGRAYLALALALLASLAFVVALWEN